jgi:hypothetical protein
VQIADNDKHGFPVPYDYRPSFSGRGLCPDGFSGKPAHLAEKFR